MGYNKFTDRFTGWEEKVREKYNLDEEQFDMLIDYNFAFIRDCMDNPTMPIITIPKFGSFSPKLGRINMSLYLYFRWYKKKGESYRNTIKEKVAIVWPVRNRLVNEAKGEYTASNWSQHFKRSIGSKKIIFEEKLKRFWLQDFPSYKRMMSNTQDRPYYSHKAKEHKN